MQPEMVLILIVPVLIIVSIIYYIWEWSRNNAKSAVSYEARISRVVKRGWVIKSGSRYGVNALGTNRVEFELLYSRKRVTVNVPINEVKFMDDGDFGVLTLQGTRYLSFKRGERLSSEIGNSSFQDWSGY